MTLASAGGHSRHWAPRYRLYIVEDINKPNVLYSFRYWRLNLVNNHCCFVGYLPDHPLSISHLQASRRELPSCPTASSSQKDRVPLIRPVMPSTDTAVPRRQQQRDGGGGGWLARCRGVFGNESPAFYVLLMWVVVLTAVVFSDGFDPTSSRASSALRAPAASEQNSFFPSSSSPPPPLLVNSPADSQEPAKMSTEQT